MNTAQLIDELTEICIRQAEIIRAQAYDLQQLGAAAREEESEACERRLREITRGLL